MVFKNNISNYDKGRRDILQFALGRKKNIFNSVEKSFTYIIFRELLRE
jgi:hypothetical protein